VPSDEGLEIGLDAFRRKDEQSFENASAHSTLGIRKLTMKTCPFCREDVRADALKCRFCQSLLVPLEGTRENKDQPAEGRITYILDRDLVRFAKFTAAVLAVFLVVGAYLFGFKLESALEKVRSTQQELTTAQEKIASAEKDLQAAQAVTAKLKGDVERVLAEVQRVVGEISSQRILAIAMVAGIRELTPQQQVAAKTAKEQQPDKARSGSRGKLWLAGATIRIRFLDGDTATQESIKAIATEWQRYANIKLEFVRMGDSDVRISLDKNNGAWSYVGTDALGVPKNQRTMNLAFTDRRTILHEFGHMLGLIEEHQNPKANIAWNRDLVIRELSVPPNSWDREKIESNVFRKASADQISSDYRDFDPKSIMNMTFVEAWTSGLSLGSGDQLSESDKAFISKLYPK